MKTLLGDLKELSKDYQNGVKSTNIYGIRTFKIGLLSDNTVFPALTIIPIAENLSGYRNGGIYRVDREINIEVYVKLGDITSSSKYIQEICHYLLDMFYDDDYPDNYKFLNSSDEATVFSFEPGRIEYQTYGERDQLFQRAIIPLVFSSWEAAPTFTKTATITDTDLRSIGEYIYALLRDDSSLSKIKFFYSHGNPPIKVGAGVVASVLENVDQRTRRETGRDNPTGLIDVIVWSKASPFEGALDLNLEQIELIKDVLQEDQNLGGRVYRSNIDRIEYGINFESMLYVSRIMFNTYAYNKIPT